MQVGCALPTPTKRVCPSQFSLHHRRHADEPRWFRRPALRRGSGHVDRPGADKRIGPHFLDAGIGYGSSCFPKDVLVLHHIAVASGCNLQLLQAVMAINPDPRRSFIDKLEEVLGDVNGVMIGVLGLAFKPNTDDIREAARVELINALTRLGANIRAYNPVAMGVAETMMPEVLYCATAYDVAKSADALLRVTEWNEFKQLDFDKIKRLMRQPVVLDDRNIYDPGAMAERGFTYRGVGSGVPWQQSVDNTRCYLRFNSASR